MCFPHTVNVLLYLVHSQRENLALKSTASPNVTAGLIKGGLLLCSCSHFYILREKKKEQEREELWKRLDELKISKSQNNSHGIVNSENINNNNNQSEERNSAVTSATDNVNTHTESSDHIAK